MKRLLALLLLITGCTTTHPTTKPATTVSAASEPAMLNATFEDGSTTGWDIAGNVAVDGEAFEGTKSLKLTRPDTGTLTPVHALSPSFKVEQASYVIAGALKSDLVSPDNSFKGEVIIEYTDENGRPGQRVSIAEIDKKQGWKPFKKDITIPATIVSARFRVNLDKAVGSVWIDGLTIKPSAVPSGDAVVNRIFFDTVQMGNLLFPTDKRTVKVTAWTLRELSDSERRISCVVTDYFGAEQANPIHVTLAKTGMARKTMHVYEGSFDLTPVPLEIGRYYEIHASLTKNRPPSLGTPGEGGSGGLRTGEDRSTLAAPTLTLPRSSGRGDQAEEGGTFSNYTSFAILPYAPANRYKPEEVPFTSRTWDARIDVAQYLNHRLGIRIGGIWGGWEPEPPYKPHAATIEVLEKQGMGFLTGSPAFAVEHKSPGYEKWTDESLRAGVRNFIAKYGHIRPMIINLGNEPSNKGEDVKRVVQAYKSIYEEVKKIDPSIIVVGTSVGASEDFFAAGFGQYLDAYDFHIYGDSFEVRDTIENLFPAMWAKYGNKKPIWSTELGFSSHGMARLPVVREMVKKTVNFFAAGGTNMSWFGIMYPDPDAVIVGTGGESHNVFNCRYERYAPKLDGVSYYNIVNAIGAKKFVAEKVYEGGVKAFLFRDKEGLTLQTLYMEKGRRDVLVPLESVTEVTVIRVDGTRSTLFAGNGGVTLTVGEDPLLLLYAGGAEKLAEKLDEPIATVAKSTHSIVAGEGASIDLLKAHDVKATFKVPYGWKVRDVVGLGESTPGRGAPLQYRVDSSVTTNAREGDITIRLTDKTDRAVGELYCRPGVTGAIAMSVLPVPASADNPAGIKLAIRNNGKDAQKVAWSAELLSSKPVMQGEYPEKPVATDAHFAGETSGDLTLAAGASQGVFVPMAKIDPHTVYFVRGTVKDSTGRLVIDERPVAGFVPVPKATVTIDGELNDLAWQQAKVNKIDRIDEYFNFRKPNRDKQWTGPADLSAEIRYLWDDQYLYVAVSVTDDTAGGLQTDGMIWAQDGLQFLVDPLRSAKVKAGRYDYGVAVSKKGPQAWGYLTADSALAPSGEVKDFKLGIKNTKAGTGNTTYEVAIPWSRLSPFKPAVGADLGFTLIVNEDDGHGRDSFLTWFGNAHSKDIETVGDLILMDEKK